MTPEQRMAEMLRQQTIYWDQLKASPERYREYLERNYRLRAVDPNDPHSNTSHGPIPVGPPGYR